MHLVDRSTASWAPPGVVGGNLPLAVGDALAAALSAVGPRRGRVLRRRRRPGRHFHESVNLAALWKLPVIFVCENNGMAEFTSREEHTNVERVSDVVAPYGFERATVDGSDVPAVWAAFGAFLRRRAQRRGPVPARVPDAPPARPLRGRRAGVSRRAGRAGVGSGATRSRASSAHGAGAGLGRQSEVADELEAAAAREVEQAVEFARASPLPTTGAGARRLVYAAIEPSLSRDHVRRGDRRRRSRRRCAPTSA